MIERDLAVELVGLAYELRDAGVDVDTSRVMAGARALAHFDPPTVEGLYWATRLTFCSRLDDIARFDLAFNRWLAVPAQTGSPEPRTDLIAVVGPVAGERDGDGDGTSAAQVGLAAGAVELLVQRDLTALNPTERAQINALIALLAPYTGTHRSSRRTPGGHVRVDPARTARGMLRNGGEPAQLRYRRRIRRPRRLVLLLDISESMADYSDGLLRFAHAAVRARPGTTEVFTLGTRLTRLTPYLRARDPELAINVVAGLTSGWGGGTELGRVMRDFLRVWGGRRDVRSAVAVFASDGWESDPHLLSEQMARLRRLAHHVIWVNPQAGWPGFRPVAKGLKSSLPVVDEHVAGHSFAALRSLAALIASV